MLLPNTVTTLYSMCDNIADGYPRPILLVLVSGREIREIIILTSLTLITETFNMIPGVSSHKRKCPPLITNASPEDRVYVFCGGFFWSLLKS